MTKLINKGDATINLYFTIDTPIMGDASLLLVSDFDLSEYVVALPEPLISNERYILFNLSNAFTNLNDGLYTYQLSDEYGILEQGSAKIQTDDFGDVEPVAYTNADDDDFVVYED